MQSLWYTIEGISADPEDIPFQYIRQMAELFYDTDYMLDFYYDYEFFDGWGCRECDVLWLDPSEMGIPCWCCGGWPTRASVMYELQTEEQYATRAIDEQS